MGATELNFLLLATQMSADNGNVCISPCPNVCTYTYPHCYVLTIDTRTAHSIPRFISSLDQLTVPLMGFCIAHFLG